MSYGLETTMERKRETIRLLGDISRTTLRLRKYVARTMNDYPRFGVCEFNLASQLRDKVAKICDALNKIEADFAPMSEEERQKENKMGRPFNREESLKARKALCNAETYMRTIRECLWKEPLFDVEKTLCDLENVRDTVKRIADAIPDEMKVMKPVSELVLNEDGSVAIRCADPEKGFCDDSAQERYEASKDDCDDGSETLEEREATSRNIQEEVPDAEEESERWAYIKIPSGAAKKKNDALKILYDMIDALFKVKFKVEKNPVLSDEVLANIGASNFALSMLINAVLEEKK